MKMQENSDEKFAFFSLPWIFCLKSLIFCVYGC